MFRDNAIYLLFIYLFATLELQGEGRGGWWTTEAMVWVQTPGSDYKRTLVKVKQTSFYRLNVPEKTN